MLKLGSFKKGGVHPDENKHFSNNAHIINSDLPKTVKIPLRQHLGASAKAFVKKGDIVKEGDLIGKSVGIFSANVHASIQGKVVDITTGLTVSGFYSEMVVIDFEGKFEKKKNTFNWQLLNREELLNKIVEAGIVGLGGAAFPTHIKMSPPKEKKLDLLIANGVECEPYLTCDHMLMLEKAKEIIEGIKILLKLIRIDKAIIGIENNKKDAIKLMDDLCSDEKNIDVLPLKVNYPQGAEKQLILAATNKEVPSGALPMDVGCIVSNVGTIYSIYEAVIYNRPLIERIVTVTGNIVKKPGNYKTRIGTPISNLIEECGLREEPKKVIVGGPMMGFSQESLDVPIVKGTSGILVLSKKEAQAYKEGPCIRCGECIRVCPAYLMPCTMKEFCQANLFEQVKDIGLLDCIECGACSYICPSKIPLVQYFRMGKIMLKSESNYIEYKFPVIPFA